MLLSEYCNHSEQEAYDSVGFPKGFEYYIENILMNIAGYLLYENEGIRNSYTLKVLQQVYGPNLLSGTLEGAFYIQRKRQQQEQSLIHSVEDCVESLRELLSALAHFTDLSESMRLPMRISSKLFAYMSVLLTIPLEDASLGRLQNFLIQSSEIAVIEKWCELINDGCKLFPRHAISSRETIRTGVKSLDVRSVKSSWWSWIGLDSFTEPIVSEERQDFTADKRHNLLFVMTAVSAAFIYFASLGSYK